MGCINLVVFFVCSNKTDPHHLVLKINFYDYLIAIAFNVEYDSVTPQDAACRIPFLYFVSVLPSIFSAS